ncbi:hypothetical protein BY996DRAFT_6410176 [Phakopsora pachyrhizi]|nr:hypothetical protein BY996DRAFT_6410176 [Phakopsora pachyrhizi]
MCNTNDNSEVANLQPLAEVVVSPPPPLFLQNGDILKAILANYCTLLLSTWKTSLNSIIALIKNRKIDLCGEYLPTYLPSGIQIKSDYGTSISHWLNHLEDAGLDLFLAKSIKPFFSKEILNTAMLFNCDTPIGHLFKYLHNIVMILQPLGNPSSVNA